MESKLLEVLPNLGVGIATVVVLYLVFRIFIEALNKREEAFRNYVTENNHKITELVIQSTLAIKESSEAIKKSGQFIQSATEAMREVRDHLIKDH